MIIYSLGFVIAFILGATMMERVDGRICTGEPDFFAAFVAALLWPFIFFIIVLLFVHDYFEKKVS